jgi:trehalose 6-phosphate phosphatase
MSTGVHQRLARLARKVKVAVVSGRSLSDLRPRVPAEVDVCIGNHGAEGAAIGADPTQARELCMAWAHQLNTWLTESAADRGVVLENKGLTLSVHYRLARDRLAAAHLVAALVKQLVPAPYVIGGKLVLNLLPTDAHTKFDALADLAKREDAEHVLFVGDDATDEIVFARAPAHWITVRVELDRSSRARFFLHQQSEVAMLLDQLLTLLRAPTARDATTH